MVLLSRETAVATAFTVSKKRGHASAGNKYDFFGIKQEDTIIITFSRFIPPIVAHDISIQSSSPFRRSIIYTDK